ncbi:MAG: polyphosphate kinase 1 [Coleofasciculaceae cyanobacterium SM2_1_6]|nr:polyphosphate kinase 1 [Coleofasciculaceae cyanobacterium SM2_1_6]
MTQSQKIATKINLQNPEYYFNREISWLQFNSRVLQESLDPRTPLLERLKFLAIFSNNLDEFFMVRVAVIKEQIEAGVTKLSMDGLTPVEQLEAISQHLRPLVQTQHQHFEQELRQLLFRQGIQLMNYVDLNQEQRVYLHQYFEEQIFPVLTPLAVDPSHPFPHISNLSLNLAVVVKDPDTGKEMFARIKVPRKSLPRFVKLPAPTSEGSKKSKTTVFSYVPLEQVMAHNLDALFPGLNIQEYHIFRITRNADLEVEEDEADDLLLAIEQELRKRRLGGSAVRLELYASTPETVRSMLQRELELEDQDIYAVEGLLGLGDLMSLMEIPLPELKDTPWTAVVPPRLRSDQGEVSPEKGNGESSNYNGMTDLLSDGVDVFKVIRQGDLLLHHPYHSFSATVQRFIIQAAQDPDVLAIKMTLYRTSGDSPILQALMTAAELGKQVAVLVELKARFDEENNINWARKLEQAGVHVVYGLAGLKTHSKVMLVVRREQQKIRRYMHIGTGNYNPKTAKLYTDLGILTCREELGADLTDLFNFLTGYSRQKSYRKLLVAPVSLRDRMLELIRREAEHCHQGGSGRIVAKMNSLVDQEVIATLYEASLAGVKIDLIIRGICCLKPGVKGLSENINVVSVVGRYLEHSRIFYFHNMGAEEVYIGSADWMTRNLDRRVEVVTPVEDPAIAKDLQEILGIMLADNRQGWDLSPSGDYKQRRPTSDDQEQSGQNLLMNIAMGAN